MTVDGYQIINEEVVCDECLEKPMNCKFCHDTMVEIEDGHACDYCGATFNPEKPSVVNDPDSNALGPLDLRWTMPVKNMRCGCCKGELSMDELAGEDDNGAICQACFDKMIAKPQFKLNQDIWYMRENRPCCGTIWTVCNVQNSHDAWAHTNEQKDTWQHFGPSGIIYVTAHGLVKEEEGYDSKAKLLESL
jgi:hypothetical protein